MFVPVAVVTELGGGPGPRQSQCLETVIRAMDLQVSGAALSVVRTKIRFAGASDERPVQSCSGTATKSSSKTGTRRAFKVQATKVYAKIIYS